MGQRRKPRLVAAAVVAAAVTGAAAVAGAITINPGPLHTPDPDGPVIDWTQVEPGPVDDWRTYPPDQVSDWDSDEPVGDLYGPLWWLS